VLNAIAAATIRNERSLANTLPLKISHCCFSTPLLPGLPLLCPSVQQTFRFQFAKEMAMPTVGLPWCLRTSGFRDNKVLQSVDHPRAGPKQTFCTALTEGCRQTSAYLRLLCYLLFHSPAVEFCVNLWQRFDCCPALCTASTNPNPCSRLPKPTDFSSPRGGVQEFYLAFKTFTSGFRLQAGTP
jgi:hypothetical protein